MERELIGLWLLSKGLMAGLAIAVPVGPVNVLCASRTLRKGRLSGLLSGFGAATADTLYGAIAGFSITFLIQFLEREEFWIRVLGGLLLMGIGTMYFCKPARDVDLPSENGAAGSDFSSTLLLTLTNPTTILSFLAVLAGLGMGGHRLWWLTFLLVAGNPLKLSKMVEGPDRDVPLLGADTQSVLGELLGLDGPTVDALVADGVVQAATPPEDPA